MIVQNLASCRDSLVCVFDLKGSVRDRRVSHETSIKKVSKHIVYKDVDFQTIFGAIHLEASEDVIGTLTRDVRML
jgi:hypothetical protein